MANGYRGFACRQLETLFHEGTVVGLTDAQLLERFTSRRGESAEMAFEALVHRHGPMVFRVCRAVLRDSQDAQDAFQATFLVLVKKARGLWVRESLGPWLHQVAHRTACRSRSALARRRRHERLATSSAAEWADGAVLDDLGDVLHEELGRLPERYRAAVVLCLLEGLSPEQAARHLDCPVGTVHSRLARGRALLRDRLTRRGLAPVVGVIGMALSEKVASAAVPAALADSTVHSAIRFAAGRISMTDVASASVAELTEGVLKMILFAKLKGATYFVAALGLVFAVGALAQYQPAYPPAGGLPWDGLAPRSESSSATVEPRGDVEKELLRLEREWANAIANRDRAVVDRILDEEIIVTDPVGRTWDKVKYLAEIGTNAWGIDFLELSDISIHVYARAAVVTGQAMVKTNSSNPSGTGNYRVTNTYILREGRWRCVASHNSSIFDQPANNGDAELGDPTQPQGGNKPNQPQSGKQQPQGGNKPNQPQGADKQAPGGNKPNQPQGGNNPNQPRGGN
jgi:RNA polymerase sigma factor (sigma-70 family)